MPRAIATPETVNSCVDVNKVDTLKQTLSSSVIVVIDPSIPAYETLATGVIAGATVHLLDRQRDGIEQISEWLHTTVLSPNAASLALHLITPGSPGCVFLGNTQLHASTIERYAWELQSWFTALPSQLLLYGSRIGAGPSGTEFLRTLHTLTGATLHASTLNVGHPSLGGTWELDVTIGPLKPMTILTPEIQATYPTIL